MSQQVSKTKTQKVKAPVVNIDGRLVRGGEEITGHPARTKYLGAHTTKGTKPRATEPAEKPSTKKTGDAEV